uniref:probable ATP-dependent RNA helicase DHX58 isoform X2 n=1 Tax=Ciona intestinalis TaxID=7719 RepID=UPI000EF49AFD|nr:probable ATP-dependent RNA helicase DHX58 isoform X2 [Ciona intestinalis]|eukprot:XP_026695030.1 probable ATP-dependent RNA helicase DHX58 isoform X2 [Ciona intestinalis]
MGESVKYFMSHWGPFLKIFLAPRSILNNFPHMEDDVRKQITDEGNKIKQVELFIKYLEECEEPGILQAFLDALRNSQGTGQWIADVLDGKLDHQLGKCEEYMQDVPQIKKLFILIKKDLNVIDFEDFTSFFSHHLDTEEKEEIQSVFVKGNSAAGTAFFSIIVRKPPSWLKEFLEEIEGQHYIHKLHGSLAAALREYFFFYEERTSDNRDGETIESQTHAEPEPFESNNFDQRPKTSLLRCMDMLNITRGEHSGSIKQLKLRNYQLELAEQALQGNNSLIVAPTGTGKTLVAQHICTEHLRRNPNSKIVFLVPRVVLVEQQHDAFDSQMKYEQGMLCKISSENTTNAAPNFLIMGHKITFMTPQILFNYLEKDCDFINELGLLIYDECHHAMKGDPYNSIMKVYHDNLTKYNGAKPLPQVIGMTASPGVGGAKSVQAATQHIKRLLANLNVTTAPVEVIENKKELGKHTTETTCEIRRIDRKKTQFQENMVTLINKIWENLKIEFEKAENEVKDIDTNLKAKPGTQAFEAWCVQLRESSSTLRNDKLSQRLQEYAQHLREYNNSLMIDYDLTSTEACDYVTQFWCNACTTVVPELEQLHEDYAPKREYHTSPILRKLFEILTAEFVDFPESKCIIFVRTRCIAKALVTCLMEDFYDLKPKQLTGVGASAGDGGMTRVEQEDTISSFRDGSTKIIVATSVAEEGFDIPACNLVIAYNYSTNEIGHVQRQGRGRAKESKMFLLAYEGSALIHQEETNIAQLECSREALKQIRNTNSTILEQEIKEFQRLLKVERESERSAAQRQIEGAIASNKIWTFLCKKCKKVATTSDKFQHINHQV